MPCHRGAGGGMGQRLARRRVERGLRLYNEQRPEEAVRAWRKTLRTIAGSAASGNDGPAPCSGVVAGTSGSGTLHIGLGGTFGGSGEGWAVPTSSSSSSYPPAPAENRFATLGYLCQAYLDWGRFREALDLAFQQLDAANAADSGHLRAEAYLNLARGNVRLADYSKAVAYCRRSIAHSRGGVCPGSNAMRGANEGRTAAHVHLCLGASYLGGSSFRKALECFEVALRVGREIRDMTLQIQSLLGLGSVFAALADHERALRLYGRAYEEARALRPSGPCAKHVRMTLVHLVGPLRKLGRTAQATACCEDALKMSLRAKDRPVQAQCLGCFGDIYRTMGEVDRAYSTYEVAYSLLADVGDRNGQLMVLAGMAKTLAHMTKLGKVCDCKAVEVNNKAIELATSVGNKLATYFCHTRLQLSYRNLGDEENASRQADLARELFNQMELICGVCQEEFGTKASRLEALPCAHIFHSQCVQEVLKECERKQVQRACPTCRRTLDSRTFLLSYEELQSSCPFTSFLDDPV